MTKSAVRKSIERDLGPVLLRVLNERKKSRQQKLIERLTVFHDRITPGCCGDGVVRGLQALVVLLAGTGDSGTYVRSRSIGPLSLS